jgi:isocitrate dehydrogenase
MNKLKIAVLPGDGIGKEVTMASLPVFSALNIPVEIILGGIGWEYWISEGNPVPERTWKLINESDAILLGAITSKPERESAKELKPAFRSSRQKYISPVIQLRQQLDLYANVRPCFDIENNGDSFDFCVVRENTEGLYAGFDFAPLPDRLKELVDKNSRWQNMPAEELSCSLRIQSQQGLTRLFQFAFQLALKKNYHSVVFADKPNVLRKSGAFARDIFEAIANQYPNIKAEILNVDAVALWMVKKPQEFGVIVAENMFGDILSDVGAGVMGGLGFAPSANIGEKKAYFEPVHGSAPRIKPNSANPSAMFLTVALLLEQFNYKKEADQIKTAVKNVVKMDCHVTYDLGGNASTTDMANAIIDSCLHPTQQKTISLLATGKEIIDGDIQDTNSNFFAHIISNHGGNIFQHIQTSDYQHEVTAAIGYLLKKSDAVIITGGLGPTSDDRTRFAISEATKQQLFFNESVWKHIVDRLTQFNLAVTESNKQQALFPPDADLIPNKNGTAMGCALRLGDKYIYMLPGPPKECRPMFENYIFSQLKEHGFFVNRSISRWLTLGLIEGEIAKEIDVVVRNYGCETGYRWCYPYLEIKLIFNSEQDSNIEIQQKVDRILAPYLVSRDTSNAIEILKRTLKNFSGPLNIVDEITHGKFFEEETCQHLNFISPPLEKNKYPIIFHAKSSIDLLNEPHIYHGSIKFECQGYQDNNLKYQHVLTTPYRSQDILQLAYAYLAWQINQFIRSFGQYNELIKLS